MAGAGDRQELGQALQHAEDDRPEKVDHQVASRSSGTATPCPVTAASVRRAVVATAPDMPDLVAQPLFIDRFLLAGSSDQIARIGALGPQPRDLDPGQLLLLDEGHCLGDQALEVCGLNRRSARLDLGAASLATLCRLAAQGMGLTFLPQLAARQECAAAPGLAVVSFPDPQPARDVLLLRRATTPAGGWFDDLGDLLRTAGQSVMKA